MDLVRSNFMRISMTQSLGREIGHDADLRAEAQLKLSFSELKPNCSVSDL